PVKSAIPNSEVAIGRRMNGSETLMVARSSLVQAFKQAAVWSWLRFRSAPRLLASLPRCLTALALLAPAFALFVLALYILALCIPALRATTAFFAGRKIGRRRLVVLADNHLGPIGQVGKARGHHAIGGRQSARDHGIMFVLLRHRDRLRCDDVVVPDDIAEGTGRPPLHRGGRNHHSLR